VSFGRFHIVGIMLGIIAAAVATQVRSTRSAPAEHHDGVMISECDGAIRELVIHYVAGDTVALPVYQTFLRQLPADVIVDVVCPDLDSFAELSERVGGVACQLKPMVTGHAMTVWSRDRWIALAPGASADTTVLLAPRNEDAEETWPQRAGDAAVAFDIARLSPGNVLARRMPIFFDGGDLLAADRNDVFVTPAMVSRNLQRTVETRDQLRSLLQRLLSRRVILLNDAPDHHAGMYMMAVGDRTALVGDPSLGKPLISQSTPGLPGGPDFSARTQAQFDAVANQVAAEGYRVVRIPTLVAPDAKTYRTYVNVITDHRAGRRIVYMPTYRGADALNESAAQVWRSLGYEVRPVNCTSSYEHFGNLHCLVNVLRRA
jgi:hypothetical protein